MPDSGQLPTHSEEVLIEMRNLRGPATERTVHEWAARLAQAEGAANDVPYRDTPRTAAQRFFARPAKGRG